MSRTRSCLAALLLCSVGFLTTAQAQQPTLNGNGEVFLGKVEVNLYATADLDTNGSTWTNASSLTVTSYVSSGILTLSNGMGWPYSFDGWGSGYSSGNRGISVGQKPLEKWRPTAPLNCPSGKFIYVITEAGGLGDSIRRLPWSEGERASAAIAQVGGISQVSGTKMWIARPSPQDRGKSTILPIDWNGIARRGDNGSNYELQPGDRLVLQNDALIARSNLISNHVSGLERLAGIVSLAASAIQGLRETPGGAAAVREVVRMGVFDDAPELKRAMEELVRVSEEPGKKAAQRSAGGRPESR